MVYCKTKNDKKRLKKRMQGTISNYEVMKQSMAGAFLTYDQKTMINKFMLESDPLWIYMTFVGRRYRIGRDKGNVQWTEDAGFFQSTADFFQEK